MDHPDLRRARDTEHYRLARQLRRTLVTLDRDYLDDRKFPPAQGSGVLVIAAPDERGLADVAGAARRASVCRRTLCLLTDASCTRTLIGARR